MSEGPNSPVTPFTKHTPAGGIRCHSGAGWTSHFPSQSLHSAPPSCCPGAKERKISFSRKERVEASQKLNKDPESKPHLCSPMSYPLFPTAPQLCASRSPVFCPLSSSSTGVLLPPHLATPGSSGVPLAACLLNSHL